MSHDHLVAHQRLMNRRSAHPLTKTAASSQERNSLSPLACAFNFTRCHGRLSIYIYDLEPFVDLHDYGYYVFLTLIDRTVLRDLVVKNPANACLFICPVTFRQTPALLRNLPYWNGGENHLVWDPWDFDRGAVRSFLGRAMLASSSAAHLHNFREGCDISIPLWAQVVHRQHASTRPADRRLLLSFRGQLRNGPSASKRRPMLKWHDGKSIVIQCARQLICG